MQPFPLSANRVIAATLFVFACLAMGCGGGDEPDSDRRTTMPVHCDRYPQDCV